MLKTNYQKSMSGAINSRITTASTILGVDLPCTVKSIADNGATVTVSYDVMPHVDITIPVQTSKWACVPLSVGDRGIAKSIDLVGVNRKANLSSRVFILTGHDSQDNKNNDYYTIRTRISDNDHSFTPTQMYQAFAALVSNYNAHVHNGGSHVDNPYTGDNIATMD